MHQVFVYGTLRPGGRLFPAIDGEVAVVKENVMVRGMALYNSTGWYPVAQIDTLGVTVGTVLEVTEEGLKSMDRIEGAPHLYERHWLRAIGAYTYIGNSAPVAERIPHGDWRRFENEERTS